MRAVTHADLCAREARLIARKLRLKAERRSTAAVQREHVMLKVRMIRKELRDEKRSA